MAFTVEEVITIIYVLKNMVLFPVLAVDFQHKSTVGFVDSALHFCLCTKVL